MNDGAWSVLLGEPGQRDTVMCSPIILYDHPSIAPEVDVTAGRDLRILTVTLDKSLSGGLPARTWRSGRAGRRSAARVRRT